MKHRKLRIAWSVVSGLAAVLLVVLWIMSFRETDVIQFPLPRLMESTIDSGNGLIFAGVYARHTLFVGEKPAQYGFFRADPETDEQQLEDGRESCRFGIAVRAIPYGWQLIVNHSYSVCCLFALAAVPWIALPSRFSVRTLLVATTLIAIGLSLIVWLR